MIKIKMNGCSLESLKPFSTNFSLLPVWQRRSKPKRSPIEIFKTFKNISPHCFILESLEGKEKRGRWTFLGFEPKLEFSCLDGNISIKNGVNLQFEQTVPAKYIDQILSENKSPPIKTIFPDQDLPPFSGGLVGYFSFDFVKYSMPGLTFSNNGSAFKDCDLMLFDKLIVWDNLKNEFYIFVNIKTDSLAENYNRALTEIERLFRIVDVGIEAVLMPLKIKSPFKELFNKDEYCAMVEKAKHYIFEGDIFQVVLANQIEADVEGSIFDVYKILRDVNPSPYMFYFSSDDIEIAGASPETLIRLQLPDTLCTFPLAGSRPRGKTPDKDTLLEKELLSDPKELAEHNMLVDLGRNDIGKISKFGSVNVQEYMSVHKYSHIMHIGSTVQGTIREDKTALDAIAAVLPAGTLSGAPKKRAIEIINELEGYKRGIYGGAIGYLGFAGNMDTCISIRLAYKKNGKVYVRSGAGIVADSISENEYAECGNKMKAVVKAIEEAAR
jgi:anthranilate synthase component 1